mmetsp:Transcript_37362/g.93857  ORF Transcript_37362/g.93857 Transcript_37362/m.93857 type:complete len:207 (+) Transcript_37362:86-706(+)
MSSRMEKQLFELKLTSKQLARMSKKAEKKEALERRKLKKAIEQGNKAGAQIYAENAIREKNNSINYLRLSSRVDAVASRLETAVRMKTVSRSMSSIVSGMDKAMKHMDIEKISQVMDKFEKNFEDLDVQSSYMEGAINSTVTLSTPQDEVDALIAKEAELHELDVSCILDTASVSTADPAAAQAAAAKQEPAEADELMARLAALKA